MVTSKHTLKYVTRIKYRDMIAGRKNKKIVINNQYNYKLHQ
jgi:hypothetical protein